MDRADLTRNEMWFEPPLWIIILLIVGTVFALWVLIWLCLAAFKGAALLFAFAAEQGFIGLAAYVACWVFLFPVMLVVCIVIGFFLMWASREE